MTASSGLGMTLFEFVIIKLGCYLLNIPSESALLDIVAYLGYKYVGYELLSPLLIQHCSDLSLHLLPA